MAGAKPGVHVLQLKPVNVPKALQEGDKFVKWEEDSNNVQCTLKVDPNGFFLYWNYFSDQHGVSFQETDLLDIATVSDTRTNRSAKIPKDSKLKELLNIGSHDLPLEQKTLTVVHGANFVDLSFTNFVHHRPDVVKFWSDELMKISYNLLALNSSPITYLRKTHARLTILKDKNGKIPFKQIAKVFARHGDDKKRVENALIACNLPNAKSDGIAVEDFPWERFLVFYNTLTSRVEAERIFCELTGQPKSIEPSRRIKPMTSDQLVIFLNEHQRDPRLNEILYPYADASSAMEVVQQFEPNPDYVSKGVLGPEGFLNYLLGEDNAVISLEKLDLYEDMMQPLSHYLINSSHNTYLIGHQFTGKSSVEMYRQCLLAGCRCVELDFWNGRTEEPVIVHGFTLVPEISAREVLEAIAECAFKTSDWPVVLSFENHCNPRQQAKIAQYCRDFFKDMLLDIPLEAYSLEAGHPLPPPTALKRKIIIKNKKKHRTHKKATHGGGGGSGGAALGESQFHVDLKEGAALIPIIVPPQGNGEIPRAPLEKEGSRESCPPEEVDVANGDIATGTAPEEESSSSSDEEDISLLSPEERRNNQRRDTSAAEEEAGAEISALVNYVQPVHFTSFEASEKKNKSYEMSSFVETQALSSLKEQPTDFVNYNKRQLSRVYPRGTRVDSSNFLPHQFWNAGCQLVALNYQTLDLPMQLNLGMFEYNSRSGYLLKPDFMRRPDRKFDPFAESTVDGIIAGTFRVKIISGQFLSEKRASCYVEVEMYGLPTDTIRKKFRTKTISNNGINPVWDEEAFIFKKVVLPELATVRIVAYEESSKSIVGHRVLPMVGLRPGYKHIPLRNEKGQALGLATLFVHMTVGDYVPDGLSDFADALANPIKYQNEVDKRSHQLEVFEDDDEKVLNAGTENTGPTKALSKGGCVSQPDTDAYPSTPTSRKPDGTLPPIPETPPTKTAEILAEDLEKLWENKALKEKRKKMEKELKDIDAKFEKKRQAILGEHDKSKQRLQKTHSKLVKKLSMKSASTESSSSKKKQSTSSCSGDMSSHVEEYETKLQELQQILKTTIAKLNQEQLGLEKKVKEENHEPLYNLLEKTMKNSQAIQMKALQTLHNNGVEEMKKRQHEYHRDQIKQLTKITVDKQELERKKREVCTELVSKGTQERQRLIEIFERKKTELEKQHENVRQKFADEKSKFLHDVKKTYEDKLDKISEETEKL